MNLNKELQQKDRRIKEREVYFMNLIDEFTMKLAVQQSNFENKIKIYTENYFQQKIMSKLDFGFIIFKFFIRKQENFQFIFQWTS